MKTLLLGSPAFVTSTARKGILAYRGYNIHELAPNSTFEETSHLLWFGRLPNASELKDTSEKMAASRALPAPVIALLKAFPKEALPMEVLRTAISACSMHDPEAEDMSPEANLRKAIRLNAQCATIVDGLQ